MTTLRWLLGLLFGAVAWVWLRVGEWVERHIAEDPYPERSFLDDLDDLDGVDIDEMDGQR